MQAALLGLMLGVSAFFTACEESVPSQPSLTPFGSPASERSVIVPGAAFIHSAVRVTTNGGFGAPIELRVELPTTEAGFQQGLMGSPPLPDTDGMLFVMARKPECIFWMKDTPSPLSIAFIGSDGRIFDILDMEPYSLDIRGPGRPCAYALEVAKGWFVRNDVRVGDRVEFPWPADQPPPYPTSG